MRDGTSFNNINFCSQDWFNLLNIEEAMVDKVIIPDHLYDQTDYYLKLQEVNNLIFYFYFFSRKLYFLKSVIMMLWKRLNLIKKD